MDIISQLIGNGLRYWDFRSGTVDNLDPVALTPTFVGTPIFNRKGLKFNGTTDAVTYGNNLGVGTSQDFSMFAWVKTTSTGTITVAAKSGGSIPLYRLLISAGKALIQVNDGVHAAVTSIGTTNINDGKWHFIACTLDRDGNQIIYTNGLPEDTDSIAGVTDTLDSVANFAIGRFGSSSSVYYDGSMACVGWYPGILTQTQIYQIMAETHPENMKWPTKPKSKTQATSLVELSDSNLVGAWDMKPQGTTIVDLTTNKNGTVVGGVSHENTILGHALKFDGSTGYVDVGDTSQTAKTVAFWVKGATTTEDFMDLDGGTHTIEAAAGTITATGFDTPTIYVDGAAGTAFTADTWHRIVITTATGFAVSNLDIGKETIFLEGKMTAPEIWSDEKDSAWVTADYRKGAELVQYKSDFGTRVSVAALSSGLLEDTGWTVDSGSWKVSTDTINGEKVKVFECVTAGILYKKLSEITSQDAAYGSWDFWVKHADASTTDIGFATTAGSIAGGYGLKINSSELAQINEYGVGTVGSGYTISAATWTRFRITRRYDGLFTMYVNGTSRDTGTDATTTSTDYMALDFDAGDKIAISDIKGDHSICKYLGTI
uniref:Putative lectin/glucanase superfamily protein n=1 Tax=viral metagenome TaxID=1070528 RepID=A0A6M3J419_9ZZZZ